MKPPSTKAEYEELLAAGRLLNLAGEPLVRTDCTWCKGKTIGETCPQSMTCRTCKAKPGSPCRMPSEHKKFGGTWHAERIRAAEAQDAERERNGDPTVPMRWQDIPSEVPATIPKKRPAKAPAKRKAAPATRPDSEDSTMQKFETLRARKSPFLVAGLPDGTFAWFVPNLDISEDPEDWAFHALRRGKAKSLDQAADALLEATSASQLQVA